MPFWCIIWIINQVDFVTSVVFNQDEFVSSLFRSLTNTLFSDIEHTMHILSTFSLFLTDTYVYYSCTWHAFHPSPESAGIRSVTTTKRFEALNTTTTNVYILVVGSVAPFDRIPRVPTIHQQLNQQNMSYTHRRGSNHKGNYVSEAGAHPNSMCIC